MNRRQFLVSSTLAAAVPGAVRIETTGAQDMTTTFEEEGRLLGARADAVIADLQAQLDAAGSTEEYDALRDAFVGFGNAVDAWLADHAPDYEVEWNSEGLPVGLKLKQKPAVEPTTYGIVYSLNSDGSNPQPLSLATVSSSIYGPFILPETDITRVDFHLDEPVDDTPYRTELNPPFSMSGDNGPGKLNPFDTKTLVNGTHRVTAEITTSNGTVVAPYADFTVENTSTSAPYVYPTPLRIVNVSTSSQFRSALANAQPGDEIRLADGTYNSETDGVGSEYRTQKAGTADHPIVIIGSRNAILRRSGRDTTSSGAFRIDHSYYILKGFTMTQTKAGFWIYYSHYCVIDGLRIHAIGSSAIALKNATYNLIYNVEIADTGSQNPAYGEGIYVGTWNPNNPEGDRCAYNRILNCTFGPNVTAQHVDIKHGSHHTEIDGCYFDGTGIAGPQYNYSEDTVIFGGNDNTIKNCTLINPYKHAITVEDSSNQGYAVRNLSEFNTIDMANAVDTTGYAHWRESSVAAGANTQRNNTFLNTTRQSNW